MTPEEENAGLVELCRKLGSSESQARTMADQLQKRATQLAEQRGCSREQAMAHLLQMVVQGRAGLVPPGFPGSAAPASGDGGPAAG